MIERSSRVKPFAKNPLREERTTPTDIWWARRLMFPIFLKWEFPITLFLVSLLGKELWPPAKHKGLYSVTVWDGALS